MRKKQLSNPNNTTKLFYGKYTYRLSVYCVVASIFRNKDFNYAKYKLDSWNQDVSHGRVPQLGIYGTGDSIPMSELHLALKLLNIFKTAPTEFTLRIEGRTLNIFSNDITWLTQVETLLGESALELIGPKNSKIAKYLLENPKHQLANFKGFRYKVKTKFVRKDCSSFGSWCQNAKGVKISKQFQEELLEDSYLSEGRNIYVKDEKTLNIVTLLIGEGIQSITYLVDPNELDI